MSMFSGLRSSDLEYALQTLTASGYQIVLAPSHEATESARKVHAFQTAAIMLYRLSPDEFSDGKPWAEMAKIVESEGFLTRIPQGVSTDLALATLGAMKCAAVIYQAV